MDARKLLIQTIGIGAFVIGGLMAREKAIEGVELAEKKFNDRLKPNEEQPKINAQ